jgi:hypothetical protein
MAAGLHFCTLLTTLPCRSRAGSRSEGARCAAMDCHGHGSSPGQMRSALPMAMQRWCPGTPHHLIGAYCWRVFCGMVVALPFTLLLLRFDHSKAVVSVCQQALLAHLLTQTVCSALCNPFALSASSH